MDSLLGLVILTGVCFFVGRGLYAVREMRHDSGRSGFRTALALAASGPQVSGETADERRAARSRDLVQLGVVTALVAPPVGFAVSIALFIRGQVGPGIGVLLLCPFGIPVSLLVWGALL